MVNKNTFLHEMKEIAQIMMVRNHLLKKLTELEDTITARLDKIHNLIYDGLDETKEN